MNQLVYFKSKKITDRITRISGPTGELMYLAEGSKRAALIDTGTGVGNLKAFVEKLTDKPYFVLLTHGHVDHAMGAPVFDDVYMNPADKEVFIANCDMSKRKDYLKLCMGDKFNMIKEEDYIPVGTCDKFKPLLPGDTFDLGGINVEICGGAGHTPGSVTVLFVEERRLLLGDACGFFTFLFGDESLGITSYEKNLKELDKQTKGRYDIVYSSHRSEDIPKEMLQSVISVCEDIKAGRSDDVSFNFMGREATIAKAMNNDTRKRADGGLGNIVYNKEKVNL